MPGISLKSKKAINLTRLRIDIDVEVTRCCGKAGNGLDVGSQSVAVTISKEGT